MQSKAERLLTIAQNKEIGAAIEAKIESKQTFTALQMFEPNERINVAEALSFAGNAKLVGELGGKFIVFISDVAATMHKAFDRAKLDIIIKYTIAVLKAAGCDGPHVSFYIASEHTPDDYDFFHQMMEFSMTISIDALQKTLPPLAKGKCLQASDVLVPLMLCTEAMTKGADIVFASFTQFPQFSALQQMKRAGLEEPVVIQLPFIPKLRGPKAKSPKPDPKDRFFFEDAAQDISNKCNGAFCTDDIKENPTFDYIVGVIIPFFGELDFNGKKYHTTEEVVADFAGLDKKNLKQAIGTYISQVVERVSPLLDSPEVARAEVLKITKNK